MLLTLSLDATSKHLLMHIDDGKSKIWHYRAVLTTYYTD